MCEKAKWTENMGRREYESSKCFLAFYILLIFIKTLNLLCASVVFFLLYLLSHTISWKIRQSLIVLCVAHFALLYILQLNLITQALEQKGSFAAVIMSQLGKHFYKTFLLLRQFTIIEHILHNLFVVAYALLSFFFVVAYALLSFFTWRHTYSFSLRYCYDPFTFLYCYRFSQSS